MSSTLRTRRSDDRGAGIPLHATYRSRCGTVMPRLFSEGMGVKKRDDKPTRREPLEPRAPEPIDATRPAQTIEDLLTGRIVSRRSEGGVKYPDDFSNPLPDKYRGCF